MVPADQPDAVHVAKFWVMFADGDAVHPEALHDGGPYLQRSGNAPNSSSRRHTRPRFYEIIQAVRPLPTVVDISDLIVSFVAAMPHGPSMVMFELLRNVGEFTTTERGGVSVDMAV